MIANLTKSQKPCPGEAFPMGKYQSTKGFLIEGQKVCGRMVEGCFN
jgi:hypothetical protein